MDRERDRGERESYVKLWNLWCKKTKSKSMNDNWKQLYFMFWTSFQATSPLLCLSFSHNNTIRMWILLSKCHQCHSSEMFLPSVPSKTSHAWCTSLSLHVGLRWFVLSAIHFLNNYKKGKTTRILTYLSCVVLWYTWINIWPIWFVYDVSFERVPMIETQKEIEKKKKRKKKEKLSNSRSTVCEIKHDAILSIL